MSLRARLLGTLLASASLAAAGPVLAAGRGVTVNRPPPGGPAAEVARARARAGDCKGALDAFDEALRSSNDPTLHRDRGFCHEQLNDPFPAIDDYRAYLVLTPEGADAEEVRKRLAKLQAQVAEATKDEPKAPPTPAYGGMNASVSTSVSTGGGASASTQRAGAPKIDEVEADEKRAQEAYASPLREASGLIIGPYLGIRRFGRASFGTSEVVGAALRYAFNRASTLLGEVGYVSINSGGTASSAAGPGLFLGYEARIPLSLYMGNALVLGGGLGFERYAQASSGIVYNSFIPRGRIGFRHVFGPSVGLEVTGDGGVATLFGSAVAGDSTPVFGGYVALVVGF